MKSITLFILLCLPICLLCQPYYVISVKGKVSIDGVPLQKKDKLTTTAQIYFSSSEAVVFVVSPGKGYYYLSPQKVKKENTNEFFLSLKEALIPTKQFRATSTRVAYKEKALYFEDLYDMMGFFKDRVLLFDDGIYLLDREEITLDSLHWFELEYQNGNKDYFKVMPSKKDSLFIPHQWFVESGPITGTVHATLFYVDKQDNRRKKIGQFLLSVESANSIKEELEALREIKEITDDQLFFNEQALPYLQQYYGNVDAARVWELVNREKK